MPATGVELTAQVVKTNASTDLALLKVNGLNLRPLIFSLESLSSADSIHIIKHSAVLGTGDMGSVLLNDCGELLGFNMSLGYSSGNSLKTASQNARTVDAASIANFSLLKMSE